jgi:deoxyribonuclease V
VIIVDGYTQISDTGTLGLGGILYEAINKSVPVIGIAKTPFFENVSVVKELTRGESKKPLYISCVGCPIDKSTERIKNMKGKFRIPDILKTLDKITKEPF